MAKLEDPNDAAKLFDDLRGPFSTFYSRIWAGKVLGLFDATTADELHTIRQIRNIFAHSLTSLDFASAKIAEKCWKLRCVEDQSHKKRGISNERGYYEDTCYGIFDELLTGWKERIEKIREELLLARKEGREDDAKRLRTNLLIITHGVSASEKRSGENS